MKIIMLTSVVTIQGCLSMLLMIFDPLGTIENFMSLAAKFLIEFNTSCKKPSHKPPPIKPKMILDCKGVAASKPTKVSGEKNQLLMNIRITMEDRLDKAPTQGEKQYDNIRKLTEINKTDRTIDKRSLPIK